MVSTSDSPSSFTFGSLNQVRLVGDPLLSYLNWDTGFTWVVVDYMRRLLTSLHEFRTTLIAIVVSVGVRTGQPASATLQHEVAVSAHCDPGSGLMG